MLLLPLVATGSLSAQRAAVPDDFLGLTHCEAGRAVTRMRADVRDTLLRAQLEAHEAVHRRQAEQFATCEAFAASLGTARQIIEVELPAYCAQWGVAVAQGVDTVDLRRDFAWRIAAQSGAIGISLDSAATGAGVSGLGALKEPGSTLRRPGRSPRASRAVQ